jgi:hypothetical protein
MSARRLILAVLATALGVLMFASAPALAAAPEAPEVAVESPVPAFALPDGRQWEMVSPAQKLGAAVVLAPTTVTQASEDGGAISYPMSGPFVANQAGNALESQALSRRGPDGWSTEDISTPHSGPSGLFYNHDSEYELFSSDLSSALVVPFGETPLAPGVTEPTPYVRDDETGGYTPVLTTADVTTGEQFGDEKDGEENQNVFFVAATPDLSHVVLESTVALTTPKEAGSHILLYEWSADELRLITESDGAAGEPELGTAGDTRGAVSNDGSRIFWHGSTSGSLYMTEMTDGKVTRLNAAQGVPEPEREGNHAEFQIANGQGSMVFFSDEAQLTTSPGGGLYAYNVETGKLTLVAPSVRGLVLGTGEDGSDVYVYAVAGGVLTETPNGAGEKAVAGANNLYALHREASDAEEKWAPTFVAMLSSDDAPDWTAEVGGNHVYYQMARQTVEVSHNGRYLAFMSDRSLTGYDNRDAGSGEPDEEVYLYDAEPARLVCASCDPSGAQPSGSHEEEDETTLSDPSGTWDDHWVAATILGMTEWSLFLTAHEPSYLSDEGRLFFDSLDALVPQDINGVEDVYEYEPGGVGSCAAGSGCVGLISGGIGPDESVFADASANGNDVFFVTTEPLVSQDVGTEYDMYDAHVCSAQAPCPSSVVSPPPCVTADSCRAAQAPQSGVFGAPASATFSGQGNTTPMPTPRAPKKTTKKAIKCAKGKRLSHGQCVKKKPKKKKQKLQAKKINRGGK